LRRVRGGLPHLVLHVLDGLDISAYEIDLLLDPLRLHDDPCLVDPRAEKDELFPV
jgi:hypothetical protein